MLLKTKFALIICAILIIFTSCLGIKSTLPTFYTPASTGDPMPYIPKPLSTDSIKVKNYISGAFTFTTLPYNSGGFNIGSLSYYRAQAFTNLVIGYGGSAYFGGTIRTTSNNDRQVVNDFYGKSVFGFNLRSSIGYTEHSGNTEFRILNWENNFSYEDGTYAQLRADLVNSDNVLAVSRRKKNFFTTGAATEIVWQGRNNNDRNYGFRLFLGTTVGLAKDYRIEKNYLRSLASDFSFFIKIKNVYGVFSSGNSLNSNLSKVTLGYSF